MGYDLISRRRGVFDNSNTINIKKNYICALNLIYPIKPLKPRRLIYIQYYGGKT